MRIFSIFKKRPKVKHSVFGELTVITSKNKNVDFFEGIGVFKITNKRVHFHIKADGPLPTETQYLFYKDILKHYDELVAQCTPLIIAEFSNSIEDFKIVDFNSEFSVDHITIPHQKAKPLVWDMAFTTIHDENHTIFVAFSDFKLTKFHIDG